MGYETKLFIGKSCHSGKEVKKGDLVLEEGEAYKPYLKDDKGNYIHTGREEIYFMVYATIDLCKCGYDSEVLKLDWRNKESDSVVWYFYNGSEETREDLYGESSKPIKIQEVLGALKKDAKKDDYRRFKWAISLLESMVNDSEDLEVLFYGH
jgi:hypothetical protein